jgi:hypothetical protein
MTTLIAQANYPEEIQEAIVIDDIGNNNLPKVPEENIIESTSVVAETIPQNLEVLKSIPKKRGIFSAFKSSNDDDLNLFKNTCLDTEKYALSVNEKGMMDDVLKWYKKNEKPDFIKKKIKYYCETRDALSFDPELELKYPKMYALTLLYALTNKTRQVEEKIRDFKTLDESILKRIENYTQQQPGSARLIDELNRELSVGMRIQNQKSGSTKRKRKITKKNKRKTKRRYRKSKRA